MNKFNQLFGKLPVIGMIHLAGVNPVRRALEEIQIFEEEGVDGAIVENYHGHVYDVKNTLSELSKLERKIKIGVNILPNEFETSFGLANDYGAKFIQLDYVAGKYIVGQPMESGLYNSLRNKFSDIVVLGGVWPKYYTPVSGSNLEEDLKEGMGRADAIVVTGEGTGIETPMDKINSFRKHMDDYPLVVGAGVNLENIKEQSKIADGFIVGSYFKKGRTENPIYRDRVREVMDSVRILR